jgi:hypothetical protein
LERSQQLKVQHPIPGMAVAVYDDFIWHRAEIISVHLPQVNLVLVDSGSKKTVDASSLRYLDKIFAAATRHCYKGSLFGVKPSHGANLWTPGAIMKFMEHTKDKKLMATIKGTVKGFHQLSISSGFIQKTRVEDILVNLGLAEKDISLDYSYNGVLVSSRRFWLLVSCSSFLLPVLKPQQPKLLLSSISTFVHIVYKFQ